MCVRVCAQTHVYTHILRVIEAYYGYRKHNFHKWVIEYDGQ